MTHSCHQWCAKEDLIVPSVGAKAVIGRQTMEHAAVAGLCPAVVLNPDNGMG